MFPRIVPSAGVRGKGPPTTRVPALPRASPQRPSRLRRALGQARQVRRPPVPQGGGGDRRSRREDRRDYEGLGPRSHLTWGACRVQLLRSGPCSGVRSCPRRGRDRPRDRGVRPLSGWGCHPGHGGRRETLCLRGFLLEKPGLGHEAAVGQHELNLLHRRYPPFGCGHCLLSACDCRPPAPI